MNSGEGIDVVVMKIKMIMAILFVILATLNIVFWIIEGPTSSSILPILTSLFVISISIHEFKQNRD